MLKSYILSGAIPLKLGGIAPLFLLIAPKGNEIARLYERITPKFKRKDKEAALNVMIL